jgi:hypothetical protein
VSDDKLVVGYQEFVRTVAEGLSATDDHSCQNQDGVNYREMAQTLWASGYRFDPEARKQWLIVEMRAKGSAEMIGHLNEMLKLMGVEL